MTKPTHNSTSGDKYLRLQKLARTSGRSTQQLIELYVLERFLARLSESKFHSTLILKGGMLLLALGDSRATRDVDFLAVQIEKCRSRSYGDDPRDRIRTAERWRGL